MEVFFTENPFKKKAERRCTERVSLGHRCETLTAQYLENKGWKVVDRNMHFDVGEIDLLAFDPFRNRFVVVEVRSKSSKDYRPALTLPPVKVKRLKKLVALVQIKKKAPVHLLFVEVFIRGKRAEFFEYAIENY